MALGFGVCSRVEGPLSAKIMGLASEKQLGGALKLLKNISK